MRTTLTLDDDLAAALKELAYTRQESLKHVINEAIRAGLRSASLPLPAKAYRVRPTALGRVAPGIDIDRTLRLAAELEDEGLTAKLEARK